MKDWLRRKTGSDMDLDHQAPSWRPEGAKGLEKEPKDKAQAGYHMDDKPIEPEKRRFNRYSFFKLILFVLFIGYVLLSYYHAPVLSRLGSYLIVKHPLKKSDLIVCLSGASVERSLHAGDLYTKGFAPKIFLSREELPEGYEILETKGLQYPEKRDLALKILQGVGVPKSACISSDRFVGSTIDEARLIRDHVKKRSLRSLIIVTSPTHSRRAWLTFKRVFTQDDVSLIMSPSTYSQFKPNDWWKKRKYVRTVIVEYQKLIYYAITYLWG
jgi:uncharacterized SAM-binding protein YcdF (DUF218 family)